MRLLISRAQQSALVAAAVIAASGLIAAGPATASSPGAAAAPEPAHGLPHLVSWTFTTTETYAAPGEPFPAGSTTLARIVYDPRDVQPDGGVVIVGHQHYLGGTWADPSGPEGTPVSNRSVFNVTNKTLDYQVAVVHGNAIVLVYTPLKFVGVYSQADGSMLEGGKYAFDPAGPQPCDARTWYQNGTC